SIADRRSLVSRIDPPHSSARWFAFEITAEGNANPSGQRTTISMPRIAAIYRVEIGRESDRALGWKAQLRTSLLRLPRGALSSKVFQSARLWHGCRAADSRLIIGLFTQDAMLK